MGFRLNEDTDQDLLKELSNSKDKTKRIKDLLRLGIKAEAVGKVSSTPKPTKAPESSRVWTSFPQSPFRKG
jgi:hypothetical protein